MTDIFGAGGTASQLIEALVKYGRVVKDAKATMTTLERGIRDASSAMEEISHLIGPHGLSEKGKMTIGYNNWLKTLAERTEIYGQVIKELEAHFAKKGSIRQRLAFPFRKGTYDEKIRKIRWFVAIIW